jgi:hypothetical protein
MHFGGAEVRVEEGKVYVDGKEVGGGDPRVIVRRIDEKESGDGTPAARKCACRSCARATARMW